MSGFTVALATTGPRALRDSPDLTRGSVYLDKPLLIALALLVPSVLAGQRPDSARRSAVEQVLETRASFARLLADSSASAEDLERSGRAAFLVAPTDFRAAYAVAIRLADRGVALDLAELFARDILRQGIARNALLSAEGRMAQDQVELENRTAAAAMADAIGWIRFKQNLTGDAERSLRTAIASAPRFAPGFYHAGRLAEACGRRAEAEWDYARGYLAEQGTTAHDNENALRKLISTQKREGVTIERVVTELVDRDRALRKRAVLASRITNPRKLPPFRLARIDGDTISSDALSGKVAMIDFWGLWCGPCLAELPDIQSVQARYRGDSTVVVLTINGQDDVTRVRAFIRNRSYALPVLRDGGYAGRAGVSGLPMTWFVDKGGRIAFELTDGRPNANLAEELAWRIEALKED